MTVIGKLANDLSEAYDEELLWIAAGEYVINKVNHVVYPNRVLREAGLLAVARRRTANIWILPPAGRLPWSITRWRTFM